MSIQFSQRKPKSEDCKQAIQTVQQQVQEAALAAITMILETFLEAEVSAKLRREKGEPRHVSGQAHEIDWYCRHCGCRDAKRFMRDGHYQRALATNWGVVKALKVPMLECQECGHDVICHYVEPLLKQAHSTPITEVSHSAMGWHLTHHPDRNFNP